jgi:lipoate-protein ligase B
LGLGRLSYEKALDLQHTLSERRISGEVECDMLLLVEHAPVITLGRGFRPENLPTPRDSLEKRGIELFEIERGGDITFHGPGQLVGYPIFDLREHRQDLHWFLRQLEQSLIRALEDFGITAERRKDYTGVWTQGRKIASIGIHVKQWVTWHGFALNVTTDLSYFDYIVPCGIPDVIMTSIQHELRERTPRDVWGMALNSVVLGCSETFGMRPQAAELAEICTRHARPGDESPA